MKLARAALDGMGCGHIHEDGEVCASGGALYLHGRCHPHAGSEVRYEDGTLTIRCRQCKRHVADVAVADDRPVRRGFCVWCQGGPADGWRYETLIEPEDVITLVPVPGRAGEFIRVLNLLPGDEPWPDAVAYERVRAVDLLDGECIYYQKEST